MPYAGEIQADYAAHGVKIIAPNIKQGRKADPKAYIERLGRSTGRTHDDTGA